MKNIALFIVLAILTVAALVAWNVTSRRTQPQPVANIQPTPSISGTPTPSPETGGTLRRILSGGLFTGGNVTPTSIVTPVPTSSATLGRISATITPMPTVTVGPTPVGGLTKGGEFVSTPTPTRQLSTNPTITPGPSHTPTPTTTQQASNVVRLTDSGFNPNSLSVKQGTVVRILNDSTQSMWIVADNSTFDMGQAVVRGGMFEYRFTSTGEWVYTNKSNSNQKGKITVTQ